MAPVKRAPSLPDKNFHPGTVNLLWGALALASWAILQYFHVRKGSAFSPLCFSRGILLLGETTFIFYLSSKAFKGYSFLGLFPLLWLCLSKFQWDICWSADFRYWLWLALFLAGEIILLSVKDGQYLILVMALLWAALRWLFPLSFFLPLTLLTVSKKRSKNPHRIRWGSLIVWLVLFLAFQEWHRLPIDWFEAYNACSKLFGAQRYLAFFLLGWLGMIAFPSKGIYRHAVWPLFLLTAGFFLWTDPRSFAPLDVEMFLWLLVFFSGFGWESFRRDLMDESWHGRAVWAAMGLAFFAGVF